MSYYHRFMTGMYRSYWPHLNRSLRSCLAPGHVPEPVPSRISRAASTPFYSSTFTQAPRYEREVSVPRQLSYSYDTRYIVTPPPATQYSDFDYKVMDYMGRLDREDTIRNNINTTRLRQTTSTSYSGSTNTQSTTYILQTNTRVETTPMTATPEVATPVQISWVAGSITTYLELLSTPEPPGPRALSWTGS